MLFSVLVHIFLCLSFFFGKSELKLKTEPVEIEIKVATAPKKSGHDRARKSKATQVSLFPAMNAHALLALVERNNSLPVPSQNFNDSQTYQADISEVFGENGNKNWAYHREIYRRIDANLSFDSILAQYNHFGRVHVQFKVNEGGFLDVENLKADAGDPILKVHVLRAIKKSLLQPFENIHREKLFELGFFQAEFNFNYGTYKNNFSKQVNFGRPVFVFNRTTQEKPIEKRLLSYLAAEGVLGNPFLLSERLEKYNKKKHLEAIQFDPFENYRRDAFYLL